MVLQNINLIGPDPYSWAMTLLFPTSLIKPVPVSLVVWNLGLAHIETYRFNLVSGD
jgi:hypothetical protein